MIRPLQKFRVPRLSARGNPEYSNFEELLHVGTGIMEVERLGEDECARMRSRSVVDRV